MQRMHTVRKDSDTQSLISIIRLFPRSPTRKALVQRFVAKCYVYADAYRSDEGDNPSPGSAERRTAAHDVVMAIIQRLFLQLHLIIIWDPAGWDLISPNTGSMEQFFLHPAARGG